MIYQSLIFYLAALVSAGDMIIDFPSIPILPRQISTNLQSFQGALGGPAPPITQSNDKSRGFEVGGDTFPQFSQAWSRSCDNQKNICADFANSDAGRSQGLKVGQCDEQNSKCQAAVSSATQTAFASFTTQDADFDYFCES